MGHKVAEYTSSMEEHDKVKKWDDFLPTFQEHNYTRPLARWHQQVTRWQRSNGAEKAVPYA